MMKHHFINSQRLWIFRAFGLLKIPSIGPSDIEKIDNTLLVASMGGDIKKTTFTTCLYT